MSMAATSPAPPAVRRTPRLLVVAAVILGVAGFIAVNAHLVFVAFSSQPECVEHSKAPGQAGTFRAAKSAC